MQTQAIVFAILQNKILLSVIAAGVSCQLLKIIIFILFHKQNFNIKDLFLTGGMPSTHSSLVWSLCISIFLTEGLTSSFIISLVLLAIVLRDAMGVRRTAGEEGHIIHQIIKKTNLKIKEFHYSMGHTPMQVFVGSLIGILVAMIVYYI